MYCLFFRLLGSDTTGWLVMFSEVILKGYLDHWRPAIFNGSAYLFLRVMFIFLDSHPCIKGSGKLM